MEPTQRKAVSAAMPQRLAVGLAVDGVVVVDVDVDMFLSRVSEWCAALVCGGRAPRTAITRVCGGNAGRRAARAGYRRHGSGGRSTVAVRTALPG
ncbi:hypothetical protein GCM10010507_21220 [Streptomyces cinnamoneus]|uniref:Uncharacterized protein n=1 Tax=Streptomyces cinnamoneus TaxID=53446 RepID=A0A918TFQ4_STRCJ|nr:hypothetical protein GCM10010507_21220 [Streptomyces cinnamoneus]